MKPSEEFKIRRVQQTIFAPPEGDCLRACIASIFDVRACLDCGEPGALLWRTTKGENAGRLLRICAACLRKDDWHRFGLIERQPILGEVPTEFYDGEWHFPKAEGPEPWAVITRTDEPSPETGHVGWCWWAMGSMGDAPSYEAARDAAVAEIQRRMDRRMAVL